MCRQIRRGTLAALSACVLALGLTPAAPAQTTWYVDDDAPNDPGPGDPNVSDPNEDGSAEHPFDAIQEGIDAAQDGDTVLVLDGTYTGTGNRDLGFHGKAITVGSEKGPQVTIIDCDATEWGEEHRGFYFHNGETNTSVVDGFTITNGGGYWMVRGAGICCDYSSPTITNCIITGNTMGEHVGGNWLQGGGVHCRESSPTIRDCTISQNSIIISSPHTHGFGGGVYCGFDSNPTIINCTIIGNVVNGSAAQDPSMLWGGGVYCEIDSRTTIVNCTIAENLVLAPESLDAVGGGVGGYGYEPGSGLTMTNCIITNNSAISGYERNSCGGGIHYYYKGSLTMTNCLITGNTAGRGAGINCVRSHITATNCTITENTAGQHGGGILCSGPPCRGMITSSILWGNWAPNGSEISLHNSATLSVLYCDVEGGEQEAYVGDGCTLIWGPGNIDADPLFVDPDGPDNDPNTWEDNDYHLSAGSPCIDGGCNWGVPPDVTDLDEDGDTEEITPFDLDGQGRFFDDPHTDDTGCGCAPIVDMGAYEFGGTGPQPCPGDLDCDRDVDHGDLGMLLSCWGCDCADLDCSGHTDQADLGILLSHWGQMCP